MKKYEIINPSDACYIHSDDVRVAKYCCLFLGNGWYGLRDCESGETVFGVQIFGFSKNDAVRELGEDIREFCQHNKKAIIECFKSFEYAEERTSLNNIGERAAHYAEVLGNPSLIEEKAKRVNGRSAKFFAIDEPNGGSHE